MRPLSGPVGRQSSPTGGDPHEDLDATISFSGSEDDDDAPVLQQLAQALLAWEPSLVPTYARLDYVLEEMAPFAAFLVELRQEVKYRPALRGEITGWLQELGADVPGRRRAFQMVLASDGAGAALDTYRAIRAAS